MMLDTVVYVITHDDKTSTVQVIMTVTLIGLYDINTKKKIIK